MFVLKIEYKIQKWSFLLFQWLSEIEIAEGCGGIGKDSGSAIWDSSSKGFSSGGSLGLSDRIWSKIFLCFWSRKMQE
jgi:hypothetical protein